MAEAMVSSTVGKVGELLFSKVRQEINYMRNCMKNVEKFKAEVEKLKVTRGKVQQLIGIANRKGDDLITGVEDWVKKADIEISKAEEFLEHEANAKKTCFKIGLCGNWGTLYRYGKRATKNVHSLMEHQASGTGYETRVSVDTPALGPLDVYQNKNLDDILTQKSCLGDIIKAIEDESIEKQIIGIYGMGGVGKTTLAMEVSAKLKHLFAAVAFTTVSQKVDAKKIQKDTGEATKRIMKGEKVLIILDDVWEILDLEKLCIPCGINHMNCKILLTSRREFVCERMNAHRICVNALPKEDSWTLFKHMVGDGVETDADVKQVAEKIAKKCGGLPLLLKAVGNALKGKSIKDWQLALEKLGDPASAGSSMDEEIGGTFACLKLSYDFLKNEEAQSCFLLCCMFQEDSLISLIDLVNYMVGLAKFHRLKSMEDARQRVEDAVKILTSSGLLLNLEDKKCTKMHDVVRDVALLIASAGKNNFLVEAGKGLEEWLPRYKLESYTGISLMNNEIIELPSYELHLPHLEIFLIPDNPELPMFSDELAQGMKEVKVLDMSRCNQSVLRSFKFLTKLRVLDLRGNTSLRDISILGKMKDLEILILNETGIQEISQELDQLVNLRRLEVWNCEFLSRVAPGVISKLRSLEELRIGLTQLGEGIDDRIVEVKNCIVDVMNLSELTYLDLVVPHFDVIPEGFNIGKLKRFGIRIGGSGYRVSSNSYNLLVIDAVDVSYPLLKWIKKLTKARPVTILMSIENISNIMPNLYYGGFNEFEHIELDCCPNVSYLVDIADDWKQVHHGEGKINEKFFGKLKHLLLDSLFTLEGLWNCSDQYISLSNLVTLAISMCHKLVRLFSVSVAQGLHNLQNLSISWCDSLEEVIWDGDEETNKGEIEEHSESIVFRSLAKITFVYLDKLEWFYSGSATIKYPSLVDVEIELCPRMKTWGPGIHEAPKLKFVGGIPLDGPDATINDVVSKIYKPNRKSLVWLYKDEDSEEDTGAKSDVLDEDKMIM